MKVYMFHHKDSGIFFDKIFSTTDDREEHVAANTPKDHVAFEGIVDHLSQRMDIASGTLTDYQPPAPSNDHEWNTSMKRWQLNTDARGREERRHAARAGLAALADLERGLMRRLILNPGDADARARLAEIDSQVAKLGADL